MPCELKEEIKEFIKYCNYHRYREGLSDVTPYDVHTGRHLNVTQRRKEVKIRTLEPSMHYNKSIREQGNGL